MASWMWNSGCWLGVCDKQEHRDKCLDQMKSNDATANLTLAYWMLTMPPNSCGVETLLECLRGGYFDAFIDVPFRHERSSECTLLHACVRRLERSFQLLCRRVVCSCYFHNRDTITEVIKILVSRGASTNVFDEHGVSLWSFVDSAEQKTRVACYELLHPEIVDLSNMNLND